MPTEFSSEKINILICDDDPLILDRLHQISQSALPSCWNAAYFCTTDPNSPSITANDIHIAVLDIELGHENGILLARNLLQKNPDCHIVFVSGYPQYVSDVYDVAHFGMVLKDQLDLQLPKFLLRAAESVWAFRERSLSVPVNRSILRLNLSCILYLERKAHTTLVHLTSQKEIQTRLKLGDLLSQPCGDWFCRCHVSYAVNLSHVADLEGHNFVLLNGERIPISRVYLQKVRDAYYRSIQNSI